MTVRLSGLNTGLPENSTFVNRLLPATSPWRESRAVLNVRLNVDPSETLVVPLAGEVPVIDNCPKANAVENAATTKSEKSCFISAQSFGVERTTPVAPL